MQCSAQAVGQQAGFLHVHLGNQSSSCPFAIQSDAVNSASRVMPGALGRNPQNNRQYFGQLLFSRRRTQYGYMAGTRDVEAKVDRGSSTTTRCLLDKGMASSSSRSTSSLRGERN